MGPYSHEFPARGRAILPKAKDEKNEKPNRRTKGDRSEALKAAKAKAKAKAKSRVQKPQDKGTEDGDNKNKKRK